MVVEFQIRSPDGHVRGRARCSGLSGPEATWLEEVLELTEPELGWLLVDERRRPNPEEESAE